MLNLSITIQAAKQTNRRAKPQKLVVFRMHVSFYFSMGHTTYSVCPLTFGEDSGPGNDVQVQGRAEGEGPQLRHPGNEQQMQERLD